MNTAVYRSSSTLLSWVWTSDITNRTYPISDEFWGAFQSKDFDKDSIYLNLQDYKLYTGMGDNLPTLITDPNQSAGFVCESTINSLKDDQIIIAQIAKNSIFTSQGYLKS